MSTFRPIIAFVVIAALLSVRLLGMHLHLCFDGAEPPSSMQAQAGHHICDPFAPCETHGPMQDVDIDVIGDMMIKAGKVLLDLPALVMAVVLFLIAPRTGSAYQRASYQAPVSGSRPRLRPPLRAPPI
jgi:hypothetical protein